MTPQELKNSILQLAIQGKLVEQRPEEGTAEELYDSIVFTKKQTEQDEFTEDYPFDIPLSWKWVKHNTLFEIVGGSQPPKAKFIDSPADGYIRLYQIRDYGDKPVPVYVPIDMVSKFSEKGDILLARYGGSLGKVFWAEDGAYNVAMAKVVHLYSGSLVNSEYLFYYYLGPLYQTLVKGNTRSAQAGFNKEDLNNLWFPLPPLAEQKRIVARIEELLPLIDRYEKAWTRLEDFNKRFPGDMQKSILQMAIQGKLVEQRPEEGTGEELYQQIQKEKQALIKAGKIKKEKPLPEISEDEIPFDIPETWKWVRLGNAIALLSGTDFKPEEYNDQSRGIPYITGASCLTETGVFVNRWTEFPRIIAEYGDVLLVCKGSGYGKTVICDVERAHIARQIMAVKKMESVDMLYILFFIRANLRQIKANGQGVIPGVDRGSILSMCFPLPPLAEQKRIVARLEELLPLCEKLK